MLKTKAFLIGRYINKSYVSITGGEPLIYVDSLKELLPNII
jgi:organic radical activating enzyme